MPILLLSGWLLVSIPYVSAVDLNNNLLQQSSAFELQAIQSSWVDQPADQLFGQKRSESILLGNEANSQVDFLERKRKEEGVSLAQTSTQSKMEGTGSNSQGESSDQKDK